ncbi:hypothetical protein RW1_043_00830 [Rhodococcus wratislaviensis NBRC 100605]|uniref:Uncharacterized protein n=1 Tax=Rhodococcus wratislaviensis NBRC 100605 TaxID=1219028 RepID=X0PWH4_RHOWR|nr:hypothetical protein RW1_043_00830 [Rhodococcus wratislaviensis NBRC 100605]
MRVRDIARRNRGGETEIRFVRDPVPLRRIHEVRIGREFGEASLDNFTELKSVMIRL